MKVSSALSLSFILLSGKSERTHHVIGFADKEDAAMCEKTKKLLEDLASKFPKNLFVLAPITTFEPTSLQRSFGLSEKTDMPALGIVNKTNLYRPGIYKFEGEFTAEEVGGFIDTYMNHKVAEYILSERAAPTDTSLAVSKLVGSKFDDAVFDEDVDVVVLFHTSDTPTWMFTEFEAVANVFKSIESVRFSTYNTKKNAITKKFLKTEFPLANGLKTTQFLPAMVLFPGVVEPEEGQEATEPVVSHCEDQMEKTILINFLKSRLQTVEIEA